MDQTWLKVEWIIVLSKLVKWCPSLGKVFSFPPARVELKFNPRVGKFPG